MATFRIAQLSYNGWRLKWAALSRALQFAPIAHMFQKFRYDGTSFSVVLRHDVS
jgi:hypothetical protein